jgi:hypothetical protein
VGLASSQETLTPTDVEKKYGWKNDCAKAVPRTAFGGLGPLSVATRLDRER